jgi:hypothetical protein
MNRIFKVYKQLGILILFVFFSSNLFAQNFIAVKGVLEILHGNSNNGKIVLLEDGKVINSYSADYSGKFDVDLELNHNYTLSFTKDGYVKKDIQIITNVPEKYYDKKYAPLNFSVELFEKFDEVNTVVFDHPVGIIKFYNEYSDFSYDVDYSKKQRSKIEQVERELEKAHQDYLAEEKEKEKEKLRKEIEAKKAAEEQARLKRFEEQKAAAEARQKIKEEQLRKTREAEEKKLLQEKELAEKRKKEEAERLQAELLEKERIAAKQKEEAENRKKEEEAKQQAELLKQEQLAEKLRVEAAKEAKAKEEEEMRKRMALESKIKQKQEDRRIKAEEEARVTEEKKRNELEKEKAEAELRKKEKEALEVQNKIKQQAKLKKEQEESERRRKEEEAAKVQREIKQQALLKADIKKRNANALQKKLREQAAIYQETKKAANELIQLDKEYPTGKTVEEFDKFNMHITRIIMSFDESIKLYLKVEHDWGKVFYFRNIQSISEELFNIETKKN